MTTGQHKDKNDTELLDHFYNDGDNKWLGILLQRYTAMLLGVLARKVGRKVHETCGRKVGRN